MSDFREDLARTIETALAEKEQEEKERQEFERQWMKLRQHSLWPLLEQAAGAARGRLGGNAELFNGSARFTVFSGRDENTLTFNPEKDRCVVVCSSSFQDEPLETFTLDALSEEVIREKIHAFVYRVARGKKREEGSVYDRRGLTVI